MPTPLRKPIPPDIQSCLVGLGIDARPGQSWQRLAGTAPASGHNGHRCECGDVVTLFPVNLRRLPVVIGQCRRCGGVYWRPRAVG